MRAGLTDYGMFCNWARVTRDKADAYMARAQELQTEGRTQAAQMMIKQSLFLDALAQDYETRAQACKPASVLIPIKVFNQSLDHSIEEVQ
jgi:hypothetical protein